MDQCCLVIFICGEAILSSDISPILRKLNIQSYRIDIRLRHKCLRSRKEMEDLSLEGYRSAIELWEQECCTACERLDFPMILGVCISCNEKDKFQGCAYSGRRKSFFWGKLSEMSENSMLDRVIEIHFLEKSEISCKNEEFEAEIEEEDVLNQLLEGSCTSVLVNPRSGQLLLGGSVPPKKKPEERRIIFPGSFNPLHEGHTKLMESAMKHFGTSTQSAIYEICVCNVDKSPLAGTEVRTRIDMFKNSDHLVCVTNTPLFLHKAEVFPRDICFLVGMDTAVRLLNAKYYEDDEMKMILSMMSLLLKGAVFLVAGRFYGNKYHDSEEHEGFLPRGLEDLFITLPGFRNDISSTEIRRKMGESVE